MKAMYDPETDVLTIILKEETPIAESDEEKPGIILDFDEGGIWCLLRFWMRRAGLRKRTQWNSG